ncbi:M14 family zinc carboxypeptidase [Marisediminicola senii]|uniref:M14 family zinc carboxypeptidase n=1 Tax=Marisediminicola senii TaxID=2711233 RepID=UPI001F410F0E|nr:M14 family zinc carboxypeptidase [Marisediminicola senii]
MTFTRVIAGTGGIAVALSAIVLTPSIAQADPATTATPIVRATSSYIDMPESYPFQPELEVTPDLATDASLQRGLTPYDEIAPQLNEWMAESDLISSQVVGKSGLGRDIHLVTITAPETPEQTAQQNAWRDEVKNDSAAAAVDTELLDGYKIPLWFNANIHGNEWEGTDASLNSIEQLLTDDSAETAELLAGNRIYFTLTNNPDGRALGQRAVAAGFDANRDFITGATAEASIVRDLASIIQPTNFIDIHGYTDVLQVEPCGPPHGENYEYDLFLPYAYDAALEIEQAVVAANVEGNTYLAADGSTTTENTGKINIPYRDIRAGWDDWPPIFAPQYVAYQGAITNTVELPLGRVQNDVTEGTRRGVVNTEVAEIVIDTTVGYVADNGSALLDNQIEIFRRGDAGEPIETIPTDLDPATVPEPNQWAEIWDETDVYPTFIPRAYVIPVGEGQRSDTDAATLVDQLLVNDIEVQKTTTALTVDGVTYPAGSYFVDMHQPLRGLANVLLADGTDISERVPSMYDISAWSLSLLWGADVAAVGTTTDPAIAVSAVPITDTPVDAELPAEGTYLELEARGVAEFQAINEMLFDGIAVSQFADGSVIVGPDAASRAAAANVVTEYGVSFTGTDGSRLGTEESTALSSLTVGYSGNQDDRVTLEKLGFRDIVLVTSATISSGAVDLGGIDVLWVGGNLAFDAATQGTGIAAVTAYLADGKGVVGRGAAGAAFANSFGLLASTSVNGTGGSNGIVNIDTPDTGLLSTYAQDTAFVSPATWFTALGAGVTVEQSYDAAEPFVSGHWRDATQNPNTPAIPPGNTGQADAAGQPAAVSSESATGSRTFLFGTYPTYRTHPVGAFSDVAEALLWAGPEGTAVAAPVVEEEPEPTPEPTTDPTPVPTPDPSPSVPAPGNGGAVGGDGSNAGNGGAGSGAGSGNGSGSGSGSTAGGSNDPLAITGYEATGLVTLAGLLLLLGAGVFAIGRRRLQTGATTQ